MQYPSTHANTRKCFLGPVAQVVFGSAGYRSRFLPWKQHITRTHKKDLLAKAIYQQVGPNPENFHHELILSPVILVPLFLAC